MRHRDRITIERTYDNKWRYAPGAGLATEGKYYVDQVPYVGIGIYVKLAWSIPWAYQTTCPGKIEGAEYRENKGGYDQAHIPHL